MPRTLSVALATLASLAVAPLALADTFTFQTFDNPGDPAFNQLLGIDDAGTIVGYFGDGMFLPNKGYSFAPPYSPGSYTNENFPGSVQTQVVGINNIPSPTTVGFWIDGNGNNFGFVDQGGTFTAVNNPNVPAMGPTTTQLLGVNDSNIAVGFYLDAMGNAQGFEYNISAKIFTSITLPGSFNAVMTTVTGINDAGELSGFYMDAGGTTHGFIDNGGMFTSFDDPNAVGNTMFLGLNNDGLLVGSYVDAAGVTNGLVYNSILNSWQTVDDPNQSPNVAFNVTGTTINGINDAGKLVGFYSDGTNVNGFLAAPTPEPSTLLFLCAAALACFWFGRRRSRPSSRSNMRA